MMVKTGDIFMPFSNPTCHFRDTADFTHLNNVLNEKGKSQFCTQVTSGLEENRLRANSDGDLIVALRFLPNIELIVTILALTKCGLAYVPIAPNWPAGRIRLILQNAKPAMGRFFFEFE